MLRCGGPRSLTSVGHHCFPPSCRPDIKSRKPPDTPSLLKKAPSSPEKALILIIGSIFTPHRHRLNSVMASSAVLRRPSSPVETKSSPFLQAPTCLPTAPVAELRSKKDDEDRDVKDHKNLIQRRRRGEAHIIKRCHQMFLDNDCHIYLVISHNDTDQKVIYNTEPGEGWPYTYERLVSSF